ncbi:hypothetical protein SAMD00024442_103_3 [Candidatus Symbiothrix dinenymphae]|nr:hypothetical protein SAMD00024442_103_3 [Candidatus Symbiothrix dinenymphae]
MKKFRELAKTALLMLFAVAGFYACQESDRLTIGSDDGVPPNPPTLRGTLPLDGGVRLYYQIPSDKDLLSIDAEYTAANGDVRRFSASYFVDSLDVLGMTGEQTVRLYATDRAGNKSTPVSENVVPLKATVLQVFDSISVRPGFSALLVNWKNLQTELISVYVTLNYTVQGVARETNIVFTSKYPSEQRFINLPDITTVDVSVHVEDRFGNVSASVEKKQLALLQDVVIPKEDWVLPDANDTIGGVPMMFGDGAEGKTYRIKDGIIDYGRSLNYLKTNDHGRTGKVNGDGIHDNVPWSLIIDLGDTYELSRIVTHQMHLGGAEHPELERAYYYQDWNVGTYNMYVWTGPGDPQQVPWKYDEAGWELIRLHTIPVPVGLSNAEISRQGHEGDEALMYPDNPHYTPATRWFRYEALSNFLGGTRANNLSEITLYAKKK